MYKTLRLMEGRMLRVAILLVAITGTAAYAMKDLPDDIPDGHVIWAPYSDPLSNDYMWPGARLEHAAIPGAWTWIAPPPPAPWIELKSPPPGSEKYWIPNRPVNAR
jgi:hypothetical protein